MVNISQIVARQAAAHAGRPALICGDGELSYGQLEQRIARLANALAGLGVRRGERVAVLLPNCAEHVEAVFAVGRIGAVWVPVNQRLAPPEVRFILEDSGATAIVFAREFADLVEEVDLPASMRGRLVAVASAGAKLERASLGHDYERLIGAAAAGGSHDSAADDPFAIMYTSGTTGRPKGVVLTHRQLLAGTRLFGHAIGASARDRKLQALPQFHAGGAIYQLAYLMAGAALVVLPRFDPLLLRQVIRERHVTVAGVVPTMLNQLVATDVRGTDMPSLTRIMYGGAPISSTQLLAAMDAYRVEFVQTYGQTEAGVIVTLLDQQSHERAYGSADEGLLQSCGRPVPGYEVELRGSEGDGPVGELQVRSESLMREYWNHPSATAEALADGWLRTGDLARRDEAGYLYLVDRKSSMIISGGENVYPSEVENVVAQHPNVADVAVVGRPDERWGELVTACIVARGEPAPSVAEIRSFCEGRIAGFKVPKIVKGVDAIPRNASGKVLRHRVGEEL